MTIAIDVKTGKVIGQVIDTRLEMPRGYVRILTRDGSYADKHLVIDKVRLENA